ncbi:hypothetical protein FAES_0210 [Fibrella aestuarina BUZ 2]|uniref:Uncharacterized protein n=2 Tax=Fibrella TaxID=861914 RepID=I0K271_9BACT|nr:hypothetical protein FAES_0210 [Fibrella aestuarina BUZ 2]
MNLLKSALTVQPGKQFELGGNQRGAFAVQARNVGNVPVTLAERRADGQVVWLGTFRPGDAQTIRFSAGSAALVRNTAPSPAQLMLVVTGAKDGLSMAERTPQTP